MPGVDRVGEDWIVSLLRFLQLLQPILQAKQVGFGCFHPLWLVIRLVFFVCFHPMILCVPRASSTSCCLLLYPPRMTPLAQHPVPQAAMDSYRFSTDLGLEDLPLVSVLCVWLERLLTALKAVAPDQHASKGTAAVVEYGAYFVAEGPDSKYFMCGQQPCTSSFYGVTSRPSFASCGHALVACCVLI